MAERAIVIDTSVLYAVAEPYKIEEIKELAPADLIVPFSVLAELDQLMQRPRERDRARSALNVLKALVQRGAARDPISCGGQLTIRTATVGEERMPPDLPALDQDLADDRILACAVNLASNGSDVTLATTDFALYVKSVSLGIGGLYLERYAEVKAVVTRRDRAGFEQAWSRLNSAQEEWSTCRRALNFLRSPLVSGLLERVRREKSPSNIYQIVARFDALFEAWTATTPLGDVLQRTTGLTPAPTVNYATVIIDEPARIGIPYIPPSARRETPEERVLRISAAESAARARQDYNVDVILGWMEQIREYIVDQIGDEG